MATDRNRNQAREDIVTASDQVRQNTAAASEQLRQNTAAAGEQFRQTAGTANEQFRQTTAAVQDQVQQGVAFAQDQAQRFAGQAQQAQGAVVDSTVRLSEQGGQIASTAFNNAWDSYLTMLGMFSWSQDQTEQVMRQMIEQGRVGRDEGLRLLRDLSEQTRRNQGELQRLIQEGVRTSLQSWQAPLSAMTAVAQGTQGQTQGAGQAVTPEQLAELHRKVDELNRKLDALNTKSGK